MRIDYNQGSEMAAREAESEVEVSVREDGETLPLIIRPKHGNDSVAFLQGWIARNTIWLDQKILDHGTCIVPNLPSYAACN